MASVLQVLTPLENKRENEKGKCLGGLERLEFVELTTLGAVIGSCHIIGFERKLKHSLRKPINIFFFKCGNHILYTLLLLAIHCLPEWMDSLCAGGGLWACG